MSHTHTHTHTHTEIKNIPKTSGPGTILLADRTYVLQ